MALFDLLHRSRYAPKETAEARLAICLQCPHLSPLNRCLKCGCFLKAKTRLRTEKCPVGKWGIIL